MTLPQISQSTWQQRLTWITNPVGYMEAAVQQQPDIFAANILPGQPLIFVQHPELNQQILSDRQTYVAPGEMNGLLEPLLGSQGVIMLSGDRHKTRRKLVLPPFHGERMQIYGELIVDLTHRVMAQLPQKQPIVARNAMQSISLQVILEAVYGLHQGERCQRLHHLIGEMTDMFASPLTSAHLFFTWLQRDLGRWTPWGKFLRARNQIDVELYDEINQRRQQNHQGVDILSLLMSARDEDGNPLSDQELRDELMTLMFAGHETTATAMSWALYWIHRLPEVKTRLLAEIDSLGANPDPMAIANLPYLTAVCKETLRLYPVGMLTFPRLNRETVNLAGYEIPPDNLICTCIYLTHHREDLYPQPKQFRPERFLERQYSPYEFVTFGGGARRCVGEALAMYEMKLVLATVLAEYELTLVDHTPEPPKRRGVTLGPGRGVRVEIGGERQSLTNELATGSVT